MNKIREIVTKAVIAKGRKAGITTHLLTPSQKAGKVLGCWIINHQVAPSRMDGKVFIEGSFDVHIWYALADLKTTDVLRQTLPYSEEINVRIKDGESLDNAIQMKATCLRYPSCTALRLVDEDHIEISIEKENAFDAIGEAVLKVQIADSFEDDFEKETAIEQQVNTNYLRR